MKNLTRNLALPVMAIGLFQLAGCATQQPRCQRGNAVAYTMVGGALGGLAGNQFGEGSGKDAMTALGAVVGAVEGNKLAARSNRCY